MNRFPNYSMPGPGDFLPADDDDLRDLYIERAREELEANAEDADDVSEDAVLTLAWQLQAEADRQAREDAAEMRAEDARDAWGTSW